MREGMVGALAVATALFAGWCVIASSVRPTLGVGSDDNSGVGVAQRSRWAARRRRSASDDPAMQLQQAAMVVAQIGALLRAGRTPAQMWRQAAETHSVEARPGTRCHSGSGAPASARRRWPGRPAGREAMHERRAGEDTLRVLSAAARAAGLGRPVAAAIREACRRPPAAARSRDRTGTAAGVWMSVAACIETAEASGSPLAGVLDRLANQLESDADAAAARAVALAGPRATAQVLSVLPVAGLGLGMLMGADPFATLLATPLGSMCLGLGCALTLVGRWWSARLVRSASEAR